MCAKKIKYDNECEMCDYQFVSLIVDEGMSVCRECYDFDKLMLKEEYDREQPVREQALNDLIQ